ncbi:MAG: sugar nucleotide-binding protein, partial [Thermodesulfobacteriota bacterium]|nr:sugar nucleotide-binding protein [Thermodesulfobacteriota bacterium]
TWYELATCFLGRMGVSHAIVPCATEEYPTPAIRPVNSILENGCLKEMGVHLMKDWKSDLDQFVSRYRERLMNEVKGMQ